MTDHKDEAERVTYHITCGELEAGFIILQLQALMSRNNLDPDDLVCTVAGDDDSDICGACVCPAAVDELKAENKILTEQLAQAVAVIEAGKGGL